jgi:ribosomal protein S18 acetylase RimI-like enzyme
LHDEFFPVKYSDAFYNEMIEERGMHGLPLFTVIAVNEKDEVIGFILAQLLDYPARSEDVDLFQFGQSPKQVCYILTLGVKSEYRRYGIASVLIGRCIDFAALSETCGAVSIAG